MNIFKNLIIYGIGAATGAFIAIKMLEDHYAAIADEEIEAVKNMAREKIKEIEKKYEKDTEEVKEVIKKNEEVVNNVYKKMARDYTKPNLEEIAERAKELADAEKEEYPREDEDYDDVETMDELEEEMYEKEAESDKLNERYDVDPYLITEEEFSNENLHYEKETLWYYLEDKVLCNDSEELVDDVEALIGEDTLEFINDDQTIYIRNDRQGSDFEIVCVKKAYSVEVMGGSLEEDN